MPTYHYRCKACDHEFEEFQSMSEDPLVKCPSCGRKKLVRLISGAGLVFKGSGFYLTDYKNRGSSHSSPGKDAPQGGDAAPAKPPSKGKGKGGGSSPSDKA